MAHPYLCRLGVATLEVPFKTRYQGWTTKPNGEIVIGIMNRIEKKYEWKMKWNKICIKNIRKLTKEDPVTTEM